MDPGSADDTPCDEDKVQILDAFGPIRGMGKLCGNNKGQHLYLPIESTQASPMISFSTASQSKGYRWNIKITQIDCQSDIKEIRDLRGNRFHNKYEYGIGCALLDKVRNIVSLSKRDGKLMLKFY